ncbi:MAG: helix-turn-helix domain-containing protein [Muribaculaceae bacterium]|nr:helix-turn-helix domain-containing protein [Muribaculaceae bacterium]
MQKILKVQTPEDYCRWLGVPSRHPLICCIDFSKLSPIRMSLNRYDVYGIFFQDEDFNHQLDYGIGKYRNVSGSLIFVSPGQVGGKEYDGNTYHLGGWAVVFHPDLLQSTGLEKDIHSFRFFDYSVAEALQMTPSEQQKLIDVIRLLDAELDCPHDSNQDRIIVGFLNVILRYAKRFYDRQFSSEIKVGYDIPSRLENILKRYYENEEQYQYGIPTVKLCADRLSLTPGYLTDLLRKLSGESAGTLIKRHVIQIAKNRLASGMNSSEVSYSLGIRHPQHFARMFKGVTGMTPSEYVNNRSRN